MKFKKNPTKLFFIITIVCGFFALTIIFYTRVFVNKNLSWRLENIDCVTLNQLNNYSFPGIFYINLDTNQLQNDLISHYPCIKSVVLQRNIFGNTLITLKGRDIFLKIFTYIPVKSIILDNLEASSSSQSALVDFSIPSSPSASFISDSDGVIFKTGEGDYPTVYIANATYKVGNKIDSEIFSNISEIIKSLIQIKNQGLIMNSSSNLILKIEGNLIFVLSNPNLLFTLSTSSNLLHKDIYPSLTSLQLILKTAKINRKEINLIDLRFDKPVVIYNPQN